MVRISGLDQMGNRRHKSGTKSTNRVRRKWQQGGIAATTITVVDRLIRLDLVKRFGGEDVIVCDQFNCDWGVSDDPIDEQIVMILTFNPDAAVNFDAARGIEQAEITDLRQYREGSASFAGEFTGDFELKPGETAELEARAEGIHGQPFEKRFGMDLVLAVVSSTLSSIIAVWNAEGFSQYNLAQRSSRLREWQGYEFEEIYDDEEDADD